MAKRKAKVDLSSIDREALQKVLKERKHQYVDPKSITPNPWNKNRMGDLYFAALKANLANPQIGFTIPVLLRPNPDKKSEVPYMIIDGEHRYKAAKELGYDEIPAIVFPEISDAVAKYLMIESNAIHGETSDADIKNVLSTIEDDLENLDVWANTVTEEPLEEDGKYGLDDDDLADVGSEPTVPVTLYLKRPEQIDKFKLVVGQLRLAHGCTQEEATMMVVDHYMESTGFGVQTGDNTLDNKQQDLTGAPVDN